MKKLILIALIGVGSLVSKADVATITSVPGTMTNVFNGYGKVTQISIQALSSTNATGLLVDTPTNTLGYAVAAYTNTLSYITNLTTNPGGGIVVNYTNYFGVPTTLTNSSGNNYVLIDVTNSVAAVTNNYVTYNIGGAGSATTTIPSVSLNVIRGLWFTNNSAAGNCSITVTYVKQ